MLVLVYCTDLSAWLSSRMKKIKVLITCLYRKRHVYHVPRPNCEIAMNWNNRFTTISARNLARSCCSFILPRWKATASRGSNYPEFHQLLGTSVPNIECMLERSVWQKFYGEKSRQIFTILHFRCAFKVLIILKYKQALQSTFIGYLFDF